MWTFGSCHVQADGIVNRVRERLFGSEVSFGGLDRSGPKQELDLLQFATRFPAELGTGASQVMRCQFAQIRLFCIPHNQTPDGFLITDLIAGTHIAFIDWPEQAPSAEGGRLQPLVDSGDDVSFQEVFGVLNVGTSDGMIPQRKA